MQLLESHVKQFYKLLQHQDKWSQVHAQNVQTQNIIDRQLLHGENQFISWVKEYNGKGNLFMGRNPRQENGLVDSITCVSLDIDPIRSKDSASTFSQLQEAIKAGKSILKREEYSNGIIATSGNGCHLYWAFGIPIREKIKEFENGTKKFEQEIRNLIEEQYNVKVDAIYDNSRLVKIIGTTSTKGEFDKRRIARFLQTINWSRAFNGHIRERILSYSTTQQIRKPAPIPKTDGINRSELDFGLALRLKQDGASSNDIRTFLKSHGYRARPDDIERIIAKIFQRQENNSSYRSWELCGDNGTTKQSEIISPSTHFDEYKRQLGRRIEKPDPELPTGIPTLDRFTYGLKKGNIWIVGSRTNIGKTSLAITIAQNLLKFNKRILFFSTEMYWEDIFNRFVSIGSGIPIEELTTGNFKSGSNIKFDEYGRHFKSQNLFIDDGAEPTLSEVTQRISEFHPDCIIFDHIQRVSHNADQRYLEISKFVKGLNTLCRQYNCAGIVNSQLNRLAEREVPALHHLKECGALEEEAHTVILLSPITKNDQETEQLILLDLAKNRGPKGQIETKFNKLNLKFEEL